MEIKTKLETLEKIVKSDKLLATEKFCIFAKVLPKDLEMQTMTFIEGMLKMAEIYNNENK